MRRVPIRHLLGSIPALLIASVASAQEPIWRDAHMQSNAATRLRADAARPPIQIGDVATSADGVREQILTLSPHGWQPGAASFGATSRRDARSGFSGTSAARASRSSALRNASTAQPTRRGDRF
jgi:hypothetical protein